MTSWRDLELAEPQFAATVRLSFAVRKHATMATVQRDGTPRISGTEIDFGDDGEVYVGMMAGARRAADLHRDPRVSIHCPTEDPPGTDPVSWLGDGKITARAVEISDPADASESHRFRLDIGHVVLTKIGTGGEHLEITAWRPGRGLQHFERR